MGYVDFISSLHKKTSRNYLERVARGDKAACAEVARQFGRDYWDGDRKHGYGGFRYDGRWAGVAAEMIRHYGLRPGQRVLDVGCGKGYLLYELMTALPGLEVCGLDISAYAIANAKEEVQPLLTQGQAQALPYEDGRFDLVISITTLHNLYIYDLAAALGEIERVKAPGGGSYVVVESYRNQQEKDNLLNWQLTCECFFTPQEWQWLFERLGYRGDYSFIYFE
ncbi:MAG: methyltransferase domain-containing protein [Planctomycetaceae bacterium]|nr:methyltransferase domain-containing protein [Planctomycetaceae bacterium]